MSATAAGANAYAFFQLRQVFARAGIAVVDADEYTVLRGVGPSLEEQRPLWRQCLFLIRPIIDNPDPAMDDINPAQKLLRAGLLEFLIVILTRCSSLTLDYDPRVASSETEDMHMCSIWYYALRALCWIIMAMRQCPQFNQIACGAAYNAMRTHGDDLIQAYEDNPRLFMVDDSEGQVLHRCRLKVLWTLDPLFALATPSSSPSLKICKAGLPLLAAIRKTIQPTSSISDAGRLFNLSATQMGICIDGIVRSEPTMSIRQAAKISRYRDLISPCCHAISNPPESWLDDILQMSLIARVVLRGLTTELFSEIASHRVISLSAAILRGQMMAMLNNPDLSWHEEPTFDTTQVIQMWSVIMGGIVSTKSNRYRGLVEEYLDAGIISLLGQWSLNLIGAMIGVVEKIVQQIGQFVLTQPAENSDMSETYMSQVSEVSSRTIETANAKAETVALWQDLRRNLRETMPQGFTGKELASKRVCDRPGCETATTSACGRCKKVVYCSEQCQQSDWKAHKPLCKAD